MSGKIGNAGKCSAEYAEFVKSVEAELPPFSTIGMEVRLDPCARLQTDGRSIVATTRYAQGNEHTEVLTLTPELAEIYQVDTQHRRLVGVTRDADLMPPPLNVQKFEQAKQMILDRTGPSGPEMYPPMFTIPAGMEIPTGIPMPIPVIPAGPRLP